MTVFAPSNKGIKSRGPTGWQSVIADAEARAAADAARAADPVERAIRYIRSRGRVIFRASVHGGPEDRWKHNGQLLDADAVIALADSIQRLSGQIRAVPPSSPIPASQPPVRQPAERPAAEKAPISTPPASATGKQEAPMPTTNAPNQPIANQLEPHTGEDHYAKDRGTTAAAVRKQLDELKNLLGLRNCADRIGVGKSSIGNIIHGHAIVGPTILAALYGETGCTLKPTLAALLAESSPQVGEQPSAAEPAAPVIAGAGKGLDLPANPSADIASVQTKADVARMWGQPVEGEPASPEAELPATGQGLGLFTGGPLVFGETRTTTFPILDLAPDLAQLNVSDLLAGARRRREQLQAELADIDGKIRAVLQLAGMAA